LLQLGLRAEPPQRERYLEQAFASFVQELIEATKSKPASLVRALGLIYDFFMLLPTDEARIYAQRVKDAWQVQQMDKEVPIVIRMCDEIVRHHPFIWVNPE
jgi:hypothetical protein